MLNAAKFINNKPSQLPSLWLLAQMFLVALELGEHPFSTQDEVLDQEILEEILKEMSNNLEETLTRIVGGREMVGDVSDCCRGSGVA